MNASQPRRADPTPDGAASTATQPMRELGLLLQLGRRAREARNVAALGFVMVNETRQLIGYRQAVLARPSGLAPGLPAEVMAVSGLSQPEIQAPYVQWMAQIFKEIALTARPHVFVLQPSMLSAPLAREWASWLPACAVVLPLAGPEVEGVGFLLLARDEPWSEREIAVADELGSLYGFALARFVKHSAWRVRSRFRAWSGANRWKLSLVLLLICFIPIRMSVLAPAEVVPSEPFLVRAPLEGVIDHFNVRPNQAVAAGDALFDLDTTTLRAHARVAHKAYDVASEEYRQAAQGAVTDERRKLEMVQRQGDLEEKALEMEYSQQLLDRVQVKASRDGVAVFADANDWQGRAVSIGERVLTIADPGKVELRVFLPVHDALDLQAGSVVTLYPNGSAFQSYTAALKTIAYRAEPAHDGMLAYRIKATFDGEESMPRIGLMGMAKLRAGYSPLIYVLLRRPIAAARQWLGW